jgi:hypothetical protein
MLGFVGVLLNVISGMLMMLSDSYRYVVGDVGFAPKIVFISIGAIAVLYLYYRQTRIGVGRFAFRNLKSDGLLVAPVATAIVIHLLYRSGVRRILSMIAGSIVFAAAVYFVSYIPTF